MVSWEIDLGREWRGEAILDDPDDIKAALIESMKAALAEADIKAAAGDRMYSVRAKFLRDKLASLTTPAQQPEAAALPQSVRMAALNTAHDEAKAESEETGTQKNLEGDTQVTVVAATLAATVAAVPAAKVAAGALPHAPDRQRREIRRSKSAKEFRATIRLSAAAKTEISKRAEAADSDEAPFIRAMIYRQLELPPDEDATARNKELKAAFGELLGSWNKIGGLFNQLAAATNKGHPCPYSRSEVDEIRRLHRDLIIQTATRLRLD